MITEEYLVVGQLIVTFPPSSIHGIVVSERAYAEGNVKSYFSP